MQHKQLITPNGTVHYWINRKEISTECIVFTHGVTADHSMFEKQLEYFAEKYTVILWDVPLHGLSRPYKNFSYYNTAELLHTILHKENIEKIILVGMSMGGYPSQHFGALYPHMVKGFVALDTTPLGLQYYSKSDLWWLKQVAPMAKWFPDKILRVSMSWSISKTRYSYRKMMTILQPLSKAEIIEQMRVAYDFFTLENKDVSFSFPVLILVGDKDITGKVRIYCREWSKRTGYPLHWVKNSRHFANGDNPEQVNQEIENFIKEID